MRVFVAWLLLAVCAVHGGAVGPVTQDLGGNQWTLTNGNGSITVPASVPGQVHLDLWAAQKIEDPYIKYVALPLVCRFVRKNAGI